jgi:hypothetical protein
MPDLASLVNQLSKIIIPAAPAIDKAKTIYDWIVKNIEYDHGRKKAIEDRLDDGVPYHPEVTLSRSRGVCSDMAILYITIAREMGLKVHFADVSIDHNGNKVGHACAVVDTQSGRYQVDPAYQQFDARHKKYRIISEPAVKREDGTLVHLKPVRRPVFRVAAAVLATIVGISSFVSSARGNYSPNYTAKDGISYLETESNARFVSQNGIFRFNFDREAFETLKEYIFFSEAKEGELDDKSLLGKYLIADKDKNSTITIQEAREACASAREAYFRKN